MRLGLVTLLSKEVWLIIVLHTPLKRNKAQQMFSLRHKVTSQSQSPAVTAVWSWGHSIFVKYI